MPHSLPEAAHPTMRSNRRRPRLLIVEDDASLRQMLEWEFQDLGYEVDSAACCNQALALAGKKPFNLALLDYNLPDGVGTDLMKELHRQAPSLPVIMCSGLASGGTARLAKRAGACCFLCKPVETRMLHELFNRLLFSPIRG